MAKTFLSTVKMLWCIFCVSVVAAFAFTVFRWLSGYSTVTHDIIIDCFSAFGVTFILLITVCIIRITVRGRKSLKVSSKAFIEGYTDDVIKYYQKLADRAKNTDTKIEALLMLASCYAEALRYDDAFDVLHSVELQSVDSEVTRAAYFNTAVYIYLISGDFATAEKLYVSGKALLDKYCLGERRGEFAAEISHTMAAMEYARGNIYKAETMFDEIKSASHSDRIVSACGIYLIMIYLATDRPEEAKITAENIFPLISCRRDKESLLRLMRCIENAYGIQTD